MLWIGVCEAVSVACIGGLIGGFIMGFANRQANKYNMTTMEQYWNADISHLKSHIEVLESKLSTISADKPVSNTKNHSNNKGYNHKRRFNQGA